MGQRLSQMAADRCYSPRCPWLDCRPSPPDIKHQPPNSPGPASLRPSSPGSRVPAHRRLFFPMLWRCGHGSPVSFHLASPLHTRVSSLFECPSLVPTVLHTSCAVQSFQVHAIYTDAVTGAGGRYGRKLTISVISYLHNEIYHDIALIAILYIQLINILYFKNRMLKPICAAPQGSQIHRRGEISRKK